MVSGAVSGAMVGSIIRKCLYLLVGVAGFEPATPSSRTSVGCKQTSKYGHFHSRFRGYVASLFTLFWGETGAEVPALADQPKGEGK